MICTPYGVAKYYDGKIEWDGTPTNELGNHEITKFTPCTNQLKSGMIKPFIPLCVSFKPNQDEYAWNQLEWEKNRFNIKDDKISNSI